MHGAAAHREGAQEEGAQRVRQSLRQQAHLVIRQSVLVAAAPALPQLSARLLPASLGKSGVASLSDAPCELAAVSNVTSHRNSSSSSWMMVRRSLLREPVVTDLGAISALGQPGVDVDARTPGVGALELQVSGVDEGRNAQGAISALTLEGRNELGELTAAALLAHELERARERGARAAPSSLPRGAKLRVPRNWNALYNSEIPRRTLYSWRTVPIRPCMYVTHGSTGSPNSRRILSDRPVPAYHKVPRDAYSRWKSKFTAIFASAS